MLDLLNIKPDLRLAIMGLMDGEETRFHLVGLFKVIVSGPSQYYRLSKGMEISGLDAFFADIAYD